MEFIDCFKYLNLSKTVVFNRWVTWWVVMAFQVGREAVVTHKINYDHL